MPTIINPALVASQAYARPVRQAVGAEFTIRQDQASRSARPAVIAGRRAAPAVQITLSAEALELLAKSRSDVQESRERQVKSTPPDDQLPGEKVTLYAQPGGEELRAYQVPGSRLDITL